jgi:penicillin-binding protein 1A
MNRYKYLIIGGAGLLGLGVIGILVGMAVFARDLPELDSLTDYQPSLVTTVYSADEKVIANFAKERRLYLPAAKMPQAIVDAFVSAEDDQFFSHRGINPLTILRAAVANFRAGSTVQGGSTITQQVAKTFLLTPDKSYRRKIREMILAFRIEKALSKDQILSLYLNQIFFGSNAYGVEAAALTYFGKGAQELSIAEAAVLAGLPSAPSKYNPIANPKAARTRQAYVLRRMLENSKISKSEYETALSEPLKIVVVPPVTTNPTPYLAEYVRRHLVNKYTEDRVNEGGLSVTTTVKLDLQIAAQNALDSGLKALDKRIGFRGPKVNLKTQVEIDAYLTKAHETLVQKYYNYKILTPSGTLEPAVDLAQPTPLEVGKNYDTVVIGKDPKRKAVLVRIGNREGAMLPEDFKWASEANSEEVYQNKMIRSPFNELKKGDVIVGQPRSVDPKALIVRLEQEPIVQGALLSYSLPDGKLQAMVGGYDYRFTQSQFNRATQAVRQPGSTFKAFVYGAAIEAGLTPSTIIVDSPIVYRSQDEQTQLETVWRPDNFSEKFYGDTSLRNSIAYSRNIPTVKLMQHLRVPTVIDYAKKLGIHSPLAADLSLALGSSGVTLNEMVSSWSAFANSGKRLNTSFIEKILDWQGQSLDEAADGGNVKPVTTQSQDPAPIANAEGEQLISEANAFLMTSLLQSVVSYGTATEAGKLGRPVAGKTGTTSDFRDTWFIGYTREMITGVWIGFDEDRPIGRAETGGTAAVPIWLHFMQIALAGIEPKTFEAPQSVIQVKIDPTTGDVPGPSAKKIVTEYFVDGNAPGQSVKVKPEDVASGTPASMMGAVYRTQVITGNPDLKGSAPSTNDDKDMGLDELMREDL